MIGSDETCMHVDLLMYNYIHNYVRNQTDRKVSLKLKSRLTDIHKSPQSSTRVITILQRPIVASEYSLSARP